MRTVVIDASTFINLAETVGFGVLATIDDHDFRITDSVRWELKKKKVIAALVEAVKADVVGIQRVEELADLRRYAQVSAVADEGEASCFVLAEREGADWFVATSDGQCGRAIEKTIRDARVLSLEDLSRMVEARTREAAE